MKKLIMIAVIFAMTTAGVLAQKGPDNRRGGQQREMLTPEQRAEKMTMKMAEELGLSEDQKQKIYIINLEHAQKRQEQWEAMEAERNAKRSEMRADAESQNDQIAAFLTPEQKTKWEEFKNENRKKIREGARGRNRGISSSKGGNPTL